MKSDQGRGARSRRTVPTSTSSSREQRQKPEYDAKTVRLKNGNGASRTSSSKRKKPNHSLLLAVVIVLIAHFILIAAITWLYNQWTLNDVFQWFSKSEDETEQEIVVDTQNVRLQKPFIFDFAKALKLREQNMRRYEYNYNENGIDKRSDLSLQEFRDVYDGKWPVVIKDVVPKWTSFNWTRQVLCETYGQERVTMKGVDGGLDKGTMMALPLEMFCKNTEKTSPHRWTYLEDELFIPMRPWLHKDIGDCIYCEEDFFELFPEEVRPWNAMLLWGTMFSRSALHIDPYNWTGTNAVIFGRKHWKLYPPGQDHLLYITLATDSNIPLNCYKQYSAADGFNLDMNRHGLVAKANVLEFDQLPGELLIIPTGWFHQAYNAEETLAISGQKANSNNYRTILEEIIKIGNIPRNVLPWHFSTPSPAQQVAEVMSLLSDDVLQRGRLTTQTVIECATD